MRRLPTNGLWLALAAACLPLPALAAETVLVAPGDTGAIKFSVTNDGGSIGALDSVEVTPSGPTHFIVKGTSIRGPLSIPAGETRTFQIDYEIGPVDTDGPLTVDLAVSLSNPDIAPPLPFLNTSVNIIRKRPRFLDEPA